MRVFFLSLLQHLYQLPILPSLRTASNRRFHRNFGGLTLDCTVSKPITRPSLPWPEFQPSTSFPITPASVAGIGSRFSRAGHSVGAMAPCSSLRPNSVYWSLSLFLLSCFFYHPTVQHDAQLNFPTATTNHIAITWLPALARSPVNGSRALRQRPFRSHTSPPVPLACTSSVQP